MLDATIMDGATLRAGAGAGGTRVPWPGRAARAVLEAGGHVLVAGAGADAFARPHGLERVEAAFSTQVHCDRLRRAPAAGQVALDYDPALDPSTRPASSAPSPSTGTVISPP
ncbi:isoaspartyl peptidase/L-asparaginase [Methylobacterium phyllosphaerae]